MDLVALADGLQMKSPLCMRHPHMCDVLNAEAAVGVQLLQGVGDVTVTPGANPEVSFHHGGLAHAIRPRIVVGADGRNSIVRRQAGVELHEDSEHHVMCGMLVDNIDGWPADLETLGTENDINFLVFPQSSSRARLYICYGWPAAVL
jgi:menaquinone-9 beta-reductase